MSEIFAMSGSRSTPRAPISVASRSRIGSATATSAFGSVNVMLVVRRDVLHDHVDVHAGIRERTEHACRYAGLVRHVDDHDLRLGRVVGDS
jgi:hypothetical protein